MQGQSVWRWWCLKMDGWGRRKREGEPAPVSSLWLPPRRKEVAAEKKGTKHLYWPEKKTTNKKKAKSTQHKSSHLNGRRNGGSPDLRCRRRGRRKTSRSSREPGCWGQWLSWQDGDLWPPSNESDSRKTQESHVFTPITYMNAWNQKSTRPDD